MIYILVIVPSEVPTIRIAEKWGIYF